MPGRQFTEQEVKNMVYLAQAEYIPYNPISKTLSNNNEGQKLTRPKRFIGLGRNPEERRRLRADRLRLRNERRRLRVEARRQFFQRQQALMRTFFRQNDNTMQRLNNLTTFTQQRLQGIQGGQAIIPAASSPQLLTFTLNSNTAPPTVTLNKVEVPAAPIVLSPTPNAQQTSSNSVQAETKQTFQQVALPSDKQ
jgi:hypothetical protein